ncbi:uncharacterized protein TNCV_2355821 [Trichonephila clavipes]|nr:uncharacterized protein TNCV_2355821 [Trichonephila clavipes]
MIETQIANIEHLRSIALVIFVVVSNQQRDLSNCGCTAIAHWGKCPLHDNTMYSKVAAVAEWYRHGIVACLITSSSPVPPKTRRVGQLYTLNLSRAETSSRWCGVVVRRGVLAQVSSTSLDYGSKLRGTSPKALV